MRAHVESAFAADSSADWSVDFGLKFGAITVSRADLETLRPGKMLNDEVVNFSLALLLRSQLAHAERAPRVHLCNTFLYRKVFADASVYDFEAVRTWIRGLPYRISDCELICVPIFRDAHWTLAVADAANRQLVYMDSLGSRAEDVLLVVGSWVDDVWRAEGGAMRVVRPWSFHFPDVPRQDNSIDCGVFMLEFAARILGRQGLCFSACDVAVLRDRLAHRIVTASY